MSRPGLTKEQKEREGEALEKAYYRAKAEGRVDSQESLMNEMGYSQGLFAQWISGATAIPDISMLWLGRRLNFDPFSVRPSLLEYKQFFGEPEGETIRIDDLPEDVQRTIKTIKDAYIRGRGYNSGRDTDGK